MKKLLLIICILASFFGSSVFAQTTVYDLKEDFSSNVSSWDFTLNNGGTQTITYELTNKLLQVRWPNANSEYIKTLSNAVTPGTDNKVTVELIIKAYTCGSSSNYGAIYLLDENGYAITGFHLRRGTVGGTTKWFVGRATSYPGTTTYSYPTSADGLNADQPTAKITFVLDFNTKTLSFTAQQGSFDNISRVFTASGSSVTSSAQAFINASATNIKSLRSWYYRGSSASGTNGLDIMYAGISASRLVSTADVTVKFMDQDNNYFKSDEVITEQVQNSTYNATFDQKASVKVGEFYYVLNPTSPTSVVVNSGGSTLTLQFTKAPYYSTMIWNGTTGTNTDIWSESYSNFLNGTFPTAYQKDAALTFDATAENKAVLLNENLLMGSSSVNITSPGYSISGTGAMNGSGALNINLSGSDALALGITNSLTGTTTISGGEITVNKTGALGSGATISGSSKIISKASLPALTINANSEIEAITGTSIAGMTVSSGIKLLLSSALNTASSVNAFAFAATGSLAGELELNGTGTDVRFGMTSASTTYLSTTKVNLKGSAMLFIDVNQGGATTINVGTLSGETGSKLGWGKSSALDRNITWSVGALNENSEYAGSITNLGGYNAGGAFYTGNFTHFIKEGSATLILSGTANTHNGNFTVNNGTLNVTGAIGNATSVITVNTNGILKGTGTIGGPATINGTLEGSLHFGSTLALNGKTNLIVSGFNTGEHDLITVNGALTYGGELKITIPVAAPALNTQIQLISAGSKTGSFTLIEVPSGYNFDTATGILTYNGTTISADAILSETTIPTNASITVSSGELTIDQNYVANSIIIAPGAKLTLNDTKTLSASSLTIQSGVSGTGTFVDKNEAGGLTVTGTTNVEQYLSGDGRQWWYLASPVSGAKTDVFAPLTAELPSVPNKIGDYNETTTSYSSPLASGVDLAVGKGYVVKLSSSGGTYTFTGGSLNTGNVTLAPTRTGITAGARGFNLVGNPYPSYLNWEMAYNAAINMRPTIWYRTKVGTIMDFQTYNAALNASVPTTVSGYIPPMQAFWVKVDTDPVSAETISYGSLPLTNSMRAHADAEGNSSTNLLKAPAVSEKPLLRLLLSDGTITDETLIAANPGASDTYDLFDSEKMSISDTSMEIYTLAGTEKLVINGMNSLSEGKTIPLGFHPGQTGSFTIAATQLENIDTKVMLLDKQAVKEQELTAESPYSFTVTDEAATNDRFVISFVSRVPTGLENNVKAGDLMVYSNINNRIQLIYRGELTERTTVSVYNVAGQILSTQKLVKAATELSGTFNPGVYMIRVNDGNQSITKKLIIR